MVGRSTLTLLLSGLVLLGCASPRTTPLSDGPGDGGTGQRPSVPKQITIAVQGEPGNLAIPSMGAVAVGSTGGGDVKLAVHHRLATYDERGGVHPQMAEELPSPADGTWIVRPDGSMQTTYRLRPGITWHDGRPVTPADFAFAREVTSDPDIPMSNRLSTQITRIDSPDDRTLVLEWSSTYPFANALVDDELAPLPTHLIQDVYRADKDRFQQLGYWTRDFVGTGPYRVKQWEPGSHIVLEAYDGFFGGRAKIDTITVRFFPDENTVVANLLAGAVDGSVARALEFGQAAVVKAEWERQGRKPVFVAQTTHWRLMEVQLRPELARPPEIIDPRVRASLLQAINRQGLVDTLLDGQAPMSDTFVSPDDVKWDWIKDAVARYDYDLRRAQERLESVGWRRGPDGWTSAAGNRISIPLTTRPGGQSEQEIEIVANDWKQLGLDVEQKILSTGEARDNQVIATYPGFSPTSNPLTFENTMQVMLGSLCPSERTRWSGRNHGCYQSTDMDDTIAGLRSAIDPAEQQRLWRRMAQIHTQELPLLPLYFNVQVVVFREGITGIKGDTKPRSSSMWNVYEWGIQ